MDSIQSASEIKVADEVFLAIALLHREYPARQDFTISEIVQRAEKKNLFGELRPGVRVHATLYRVGNRPPNPGRYRMLYATGDRTRRLILASDEFHSDRKGKIFPDPEDVSSKYHELIEWARQRYGKGVPNQTRWLDGVFQMFGLGKDLWKGEDPDEYVRKLREGWD